MRSVWISFLFFSVIGFAKPLANFPLTDSNFSLNDRPIVCYQETETFHPQTVVFDSCRPIFRWIRTFSDFSRIQDWEYERRPSIPPPWPQDRAKPPYTIVWNRAQGSGCVLQIEPGIRRNARDRFSWADVKSEAQRILETCEDSGFGGSVRIGREWSWMIRVIGFQSRPTTSQTPVVTQAAETNGTQHGRWDDPVIRILNMTSPGLILPVAEVISSDS